MSNGKKYAAIADELVNTLKGEGFVIQRYNAYSTASIYLKLDYGLAYSVRISDHPGKKHLKYTYNLINGYSGKRMIKEGKVWRRYYNFNQVDELVKEIINNRAWVISRYHPDYAADMEKARVENQNKPGFWRDAVLV